MSGTHCTKCGKPLPENAKFCTSCGNVTPTTGSFNPPPPVYQDSNASIASAPVSPTPNSNSESHETRSAMKRYRDGYRVARFINGVGQSVKALGFIFAGIIAVPSILVVSEPSMRSSAVRIGVDPGALLFVGLVIAFMVLIVFFVLGVIIAAHGQQLKASLDSAVHSSPFLNDEQRAKVMSL